MSFFFLFFFFYNMATFGAAKVAFSNSTLLSDMLNKQVSNGYFHVRLHVNINVNVIA